MKQHKLNNRKELIMKKLTFIFTVLLVVSLTAGLSENATAQQNNTVPILMQQNPVQAPPAALPPGPGTAPGQPGLPPPPPPEMQGVQVVQTIPVTTLLEHLSQAVQTARKLNRLLTAGKVWMTRGPAGDIQLKAGLLYQGVAVAVLQFNPLTGNILPLGVTPQVYQNNIPIQTVKTKLSGVLSQLKILPAAEFMGPETCWSFPVALGNIVVAHIKIYYDGIHVIQDYAANQEMLFYGQ